MNNQSKWESIRAALRNHPKSNGQLPEGLTTASGTPWERDAQYLTALRDYAGQIGIIIPEELLVREHIDDLALFLNRSLGQSARRRREKSAATESEEQSTEQ